MGVTGSCERFFCHEEKFESAPGILHFVLSGFDAGVEVVVRKQAGDGHKQTEGGGDQTFGDTASNGGRGAQLISTHHAEGIHHTRHRAEQSE